MSSITKDRPLNVVIVGGSISGLTAALMLKRNGHNVTIIEAAAEDLEHQAAGVATGPPLKVFFDRFDKSAQPLSLPCSGILHIDQRDQPTNHMKFNISMNSWDALYYRLRWNFDGLRRSHDPSEPPAPIISQHEGRVAYHKGRRFNDLEIDHDIVTVHFVDRQGKSSKLSGDFLIGADGSNSAVRHRMLGQIDPERKYAGYILWRGVVKESEVSDHVRELFEGHFTFLVLWRQYMICYHIPGENGSLRPGERLLNFAWYTHTSKAELPSLLTDIHGHRHRWSVPLGLLQPEIWAKQLQKGERFFSPAFRELASKITQPFLQVITDCASPKAVFEGGKVVLLGDALSQIRPHSGKGTSQAAAQCLTMEKVIKGDIGWHEWERQCLEVAWLNHLESVSWGHFYMSNALLWGAAWISHWFATKWLEISKSIFG